MNAGRTVSEYRPLVVLAVLSALSVFSLVTGTEGSVIHHGITRIVKVTSYPFLKIRHITVNTPTQIYRSIADYSKINTQNSELLREVAELKKNDALMENLRRENVRLRKMLGFVSEQHRFALKPVAILESYRGMLHIDAGTRAGLKPGMGVFTQDGVVGVVTEVGDFTSGVATLHHMDCRIGAMVLRNRLRAYDGVVQATGSDFSHLCAMEYIDMKNEVGIGDMIVTSPESQFPAGLLIGRITAVRSGDGLWKSAEITPFVDPYRLDEVMVIIRSVDDSEYVAGPPQALQQEINQAGTVNTTASAALELPDTRPVQECYAP